MLFRSRPAPAVREGRLRGRGVYVYPVMPWVASSVVTIPSGARAPEPAHDLAPPPRGWLRLELTPSMWPDVYVDGYFVGRLDELPRPLELEAGPHSLRLAADGFEDLRVDVRVTAGQALTYRGTMRALASVGAPPAAPAPAAVASDAPRGPVTKIGRAHV